MNFVLLQDVAAGKFPCDECSKVCKSAGGLKLHQWRKHETSEQRDDPDVMLMMRRTGMKHYSRQKSQMRNSTN